MDVRQLTLDDYETLKVWWQKRGMLPTPLECLPHVGFIIDDIGAVFLYQTDAKIAWAEGFISNADKKPKEIYKALDILMDACIDASKARGNFLLFTFSQKTRFGKRYIKHGAKRLGSHVLYARSLVEETNG